MYYQNLATTVYLYRKDAKEFYGIDEQQVFDKSLALYRKAMQLDPDNFPLATDYAESYYGIRPLRTNDALGGVDQCAANRPRRHRTRGRLSSIWPGSKCWPAALPKPARIWMHVTNASIRRHSNSRLERQASPTTNAPQPTPAANPVRITTQPASIGIPPIVVTEPVLPYDNICSMVCRLGSMIQLLSGHNLCNINHELLRQIEI